jgi:hypothetical protein
MKLIKHSPHDLFLTNGEYSVEPSPIDQGSKITFWTRSQRPTDDLSTDTWFRIRLSDSVAKQFRAVLRRTDDGRSTLEVIQINDIESPDLLPKLEVGSIAAVMLTRDQRDIRVVRR